MADVRRDYLNRVLALEPISESADILSERNQYLNRPEALSAPGAYHLVFNNCRRQVGREIARITREIWLEQDEAAWNKLGELPITGDLRPYLARLSSVRELVPEFDRATVDPKLDPAFIAFYRDLVVAPKTRAPHLFARYTHEYGGQIPDEVRNSIQHFRKTFPSLAALEEPWLNRLMKLHDPFKLRRIGRTFLVKYAKTLAYWLIVLGVLIFILTRGSTS